MNCDYKTKQNVYRHRFNILTERVKLLQQNIIIQDLSTAFGVPISVGITDINGYDRIEKIIIDCFEAFTIINESKEKYRSYVVYTHRKFFHMISVDNHKNNDESEDISKLIDDRILSINQEIDYLDEHSNPLEYDHHYGEYNKGFESLKRYNTIYDVLYDFRNQ